MNRPNLNPQPSPQPSAAHPGESPLTQGDPRRLLPIVAATFAEIGYAPTTTAILAKRCGTRENVLYRAWPTKKAMFLASIEHIFESSLQDWHSLASASADPATIARSILEQEAKARPGRGFHRIIFAGINHSDDQDIQSALRDMYLRFAAWIADRLRAAVPNLPPDQATHRAWAVISLATFANIAHELSLMPESARQLLVASTAGSIAFAEPSLS